MPKTQGLSPKVIMQLVAGAIAYVLTHYSVGLDPDLSASIAAAAGFLAGVAARPGDVVQPPTPSELQAAPPAPGPQPVPMPVMPGPGQPPSA